MAKQWQPNENQRKFLKVVCNEELTLRELSNLAGFEFKTGMVNPLVVRGYVNHGADAVIVCPVCGHKHTVKTYVAGNPFQD